MRAVVLPTKAVPLALALWLCGAGAIAQSTPPNAEAVSREHFSAGRQFVSQRRYREAYHEFDAGYRLSGRPLFLFNMAECARQGGQADLARQEYGRYLVAEPTGRMADTARRRLAELTVAAPAPPVRPPMAPATQSTPPQGAAPRVERARPPHSPAENDRALWERWPFWVAVGTVAAAAVVGALVLTSGRQGEPQCGDGCLDFRP